MKKVYKYTLGFGDMVRVYLPKNSKILKIDQQHKSLEQDKLLYIWALVDVDEKENEVRTFRISGTGHEIDDSLNLEFITTISTFSDNLIWHIFEVKNK